MSETPPKGLVIAAPHSGSGKTCLTIGLLRAMARKGVSLSPAKIGPDYIDPQFHGVAAGVPSVNLDGWAMQSETLARLGKQLASHGELTLIEGVMGLFDGAVKPGVLGHGATADIARVFDLPVVLVVDCAGMGQSVAALVKGFAEFDPSLKLAGVILNKLGSLRHVTMMEEALGKIGVEVLGAVPRFEAMALPSRHLGLVQACETKELDGRLDEIADHVAGHVDLEALQRVAGSLGFDGLGVSDMRQGIEPLGTHIAVARDEAFAFFYPHLQTSWREAGASFSFFSPLQDEAPEAGADAVYLPGGYPELYGEQLAGNQRFMGGLREAAKQGKRVYGECGGYMVLGQGVIDKQGQRHAMAGLLDLETSFEKRKLHLGYRHVVRPGGSQVFRGHEFHYACVLREEGEALYQDIDGEAQHGLVSNAVSGSFVHLIDGESG